MSILESSQKESNGGPIPFALIGIGGYGSSYVSYFQKGMIRDSIAKIVGVVDPFPDRSPHVGYIKEQGIPIYNTMEELFAEQKPFLTIISTPIPLHKSQCKYALHHNSDVLCEKPLMPLESDLPELYDACEAGGRSLGVGFQWSFSKTMLDLKKDILSGKLGQPLRLKTMVSWPRNTAYYADSTWKGRVRDAEGNIVLDSVASNATAHYLHNLFFLLGKSIPGAAMPRSLRAELYRAKKIETFDTCFLKGDFADGSEFLYAVSHSTTVNEDPKFKYTFENAVVTLNIDRLDNRVWVTLSDGTQHCYGSPFVEEETVEKVLVMLEHVRNGTEIPCTFNTVVPHLRVCTALYQQADIHAFPPLILTETTEGVFSPRLYGDMMQCFDQFALPSEAGLVWSAMPDQINFERDFMESSPSPQKEKEV